MRKIIVAGGGHGGIAAASMLAKRGFDVTVYERREEAEMGYDWTDIFAPGALAEAELPMPPLTQFEYKENMTFYGPGFHTALRQEIAPEKLEIKMERRDIYALLIRAAKENGVKFVFGCEIEGPVVYGNRVVGVRTDKGTFCGDLVIDACGLDSPVKRGLPPVCGVNAEIGENNQFFVYRAFFDRASDEEVRDKYKVCLFAEGKLGIGWVATEADHTDLLVGRFAPFDQAEADRTADWYRQTNPSLGKTLLRGGQFVRIPVRQPLSRMVCDGYAAIGDAAYMTVPIIGSGIANSLKAAKMLCDTVTADADGAFSARTLWRYQVKYYTALGAGFASLACVKEALTVFTPEELDYLFDTGVINAKDLSIDADTTDLLKIFSGNTAADVKNKLAGVAKHPALRRKMLMVGRKIAAVSAVTAALPHRYSKGAVDIWVANYERAIRMKLA